MLEKLSNKSSVMRRVLSGFVVASLMVATVGTAAGCTPAESEIPTNPGNSEITTPAQPNTPSNPSNPSNPSEPSDPTQSHSDLLYDLLTNSYYRNLKDCYVNAEPEIDSQIYDPIPYGFLEDRGYDISAIKNDTLEADSIAYTKENEPNSLYVATRVETAGETPYYTCYTLKYALTNAELSDLNLIHKQAQIESPLFIQELSYQKEPVEVTEASITIAAYENLLKVFTNAKTCNPENIFGTKQITMDFLNFSTDNNTLTVRIRPKSTTSFISKVYTNTATMVPSLSSDNISTLKNNSKVYRAPYLIDFVSKEEMQNYINNAITITYYDTKTESVFNYSFYNTIINNKTL